MVKELINAKANIEFRNIAQNTALLHAVKLGKNEIVEILVEANANIKALDKKGFSVLSPDYDKSQPGIYKYLNSRN